jgi:hypothetical protein
MSANILHALGQLDPANENHWTADGAARLETVKLLAKDPTVTRERIAAVAPGFSRHQVLLPAQQASQNASAVPPAVQPQPASLPAAVEAPTVVPQPQEAPALPTFPRFQGTPLQEAQHYLQEVREAKSRIDAELAVALKAVDVLIDAETKATPAQGFANTVQEYLASQALIRERRAAQIAALKGVNLKDILPTRSKIDEAMKRRADPYSKRPRIV